MKKLYILLFIFLGFYTANATNFVVSGAGSSEVNGTYVENGTYNGKVKYTYANLDDGYNYSIIWTCEDECDNWHITRDMGGWQDPYYVTSASESNTPPSTSWNTSYSGNMPIPTVEEEVVSSSLSFSTSIFLESANNEGSISNSIIITHNNFSGETFTGSNTDDFIALGKAAITNLPSGLTATLTRTSSTTLTLSLTGNATSHANANDVSNLTLVFENNAFSGNVASDVTNYSKSNLVVNFSSQLTVASSGADYTSITAAVAAASDYDIISIAGETFTEAGIEITKSLTFKGSGANVTIIQANASYDAASDRVFNISSSSLSYVKFYDLTIKNGKKYSNDDANEGGAIKAYSPLYLYNCIISDNICRGNKRSLGGAIWSNSDLYLSGCLVKNNLGKCSTCEDTYGGAIFQQVNTNTATLINSTFSGNTFTSTGTTFGGAFYSSGGTFKATNCTFSENASTYGGAICFENNTVVTLKNNIIYNNTATNGADFFRNGCTVNAYNSIIGSATANSGSAVNGTSSNVSSSDPLLNAIAYNGGLINTYAVQNGSPALNASLVDADAQSTDQRGYLANGVRDIGAYEYDGLGRTWSGTTNSTWSTASNWLENAIPTSTTNVIISNQTNNPTISAATNAVCADLYINSGATFFNNSTLADGGSLTISGNFTNNGTFTSGATSSVIFNGSSTQTISGNSNTTFSNFTLNNSTSPATSAATLTGNISVGGTLTLTTGILNTSIYTIDLGANGSISEINPSVLAPTSYVTGYVTATRNTGSTSGTVTFGGLGLEITESTQTDNSTVVTRRTGTASSGAGNTSILRYFDITPTIDAALNGTLVFHYTTAEMGAQTEANLIMYKSDSPYSTWTQNATSSVDAAANTVTLSGITSFSRWTASDYVSQPLPVEFLSFNVKKESGFNKLTWSTASEVNNDYFEIERSNNGIDFTSVSKVKGAGTTNNVSEYVYIDQISNQNQSTYYRLKQVDFDKNYSYSSIERVNANENKEYFVIYPNPIKTGETLNAKLYDLSSQTIQVKIFDLAGKILDDYQLQHITNTPSFQVLNQTNTLKKGFYIIEVKTLNNKFVERLEVE